MPPPLRVRAALGWQAKACPTHCGTGSKKQSGEPVPEPTRGTGDRQDCQRNSGKRRRKFMAVLSVPEATRRNGVRASLGWQAKACPTHCASELRSDGKLKHAPPTELERAKGLSYFRMVNILEKSSVQMRNGRFWRRSSASFRSSGCAAAVARSMISVQEQEKHIGSSSLGFQWYTRATLSKALAARSITGSRAR